LTSAVAPCGSRPELVENGPYTDFGPPGTGDGNPKRRRISASTRFCASPTMSGCWCAPSKLRLNQVLVSVRLGNGRLGLPKDRRRKLAFRGARAEADWGALSSTDIVHRLVREELPRLCSAWGDGAFTFGGETTSRDPGRRSSSYLPPTIKDPGFRGSGTSEHFKQQSISRLAGPPMRQPAGNDEPDVARRYCMAATNAGPLPTLGGNPRRDGRRSSGFWPGPALADHADGSHHHRRYHSRGRRAVAVAATLGRAAVPGPGSAFQNHNRNNGRGISFSPGAGGVADLPPLLFRGWPASPGPPRVILPISRTDAALASAGGDTARKAVDAVRGQGAEAIPCRVAMARPLRVSTMAISQPPPPCRRAKAQDLLRRGRQRSSRTSRRAGSMADEFERARAPTPAGFAQGPFR